MKIRLLTSFAFSFLFLFSCTQPKEETFQAPKNFIPSGNAELDQLRLQFRSVPTDLSNYNERGVMMKLWATSLQQQGADLGDGYVVVDDSLRAVDNYNPVFTGGAEKVLSDVDKKRYAVTVQKGLGILDSIQNHLTEENESQKLVASVGTNTASVNQTPWPNYRANAQRTGFSGAPGPTQGVVDWKFPVGLPWESSALIDGDKVYLCSPGMRNMLFTLDLKTGKVIHETKQKANLRVDQLYGTPALNSTPVLVNGKILMRELGSRGNKGDAKDIVVIDQKSGKVTKEITAGHIDYRAGYAPFDANDKYVVFPFSHHDIEEKPPVAQAFNRIICKDYEGNTHWDFNIGTTFCNPHIDKELVYVGTTSGTLYALNLEGHYVPASSKRIAWEFQAKGAVNQTVSTDEINLYFSDNAGWVYALNKYNGQLVWEKQISKITMDTHRFFSKINVENDRLYVGGADQLIYFINKKNGAIEASRELSDWVRSKPIQIGKMTYVMTMDGHLHQLNAQAEILKKVKVGDHRFFADLAYANGVLVANDANFTAFAFNPQLEKLWQFDFLKSFYNKEKERIHTDELAAGAYYQSKPTADLGMVFVGTPSRFVYGIDALSGDAVWKTELSGAVSGAPVIDHGKIYIGQQGGSDEFYCLDAKSGKVLWKQNIGWVWGSVNVSDGKIYAPGIDGYVYCLDAENGNIVWRYRTDRSTCGEPLVMGDAVYFGGWDHYLYKFNKENGDLLWKFQLSGGSDSGAPVGEDGKIFLPVGGASFRCLDATTKEVLWKPQLDGEIFNVTPGVHDGQVYISQLIGKGLGGVPVKNKIYALNKDNGQKLWEFDGAGGLTGAVIGSNDRIYSGATANPYFYCLSKEGELLWKVRMENKVEESVPALYMNRAYVLSSGGFLYAIK
ncbi:PQQ-binding-like beta-propeller repeat protein [Persicobacter psychrovividus]|uniref:Pyrrolo-quinoline quinone repeat domain-containing protein n=1 Tax=Persicobacter psychrovividus TaxID=387638 RepID=A0ABN6L6E9_9BACT|nr:hypothetical protein PEPS_10350 [Persicobacter psychrovividus]